ncbi:unnamed protein product [Urochloa decumbens]|uniref:Reverse transcriptase zinc-binding domain-containing protein n=1 Tax=Urochloa decumbens TaxID=240449 RepID=A0ABC9C723_9POAL
MTASRASDREQLLAWSQRLLQLIEWTDWIAGESNPWTELDPFLVRRRQSGRKHPVLARHQEAECRAITAVALGDGETTSFWHDTWSEAGVLRDALPALYSHCLDVHTTVAEVGAAGGLHDNDLQPRLTAAATADLGLLSDALTAVALQPRPDERWLQGLQSNKVRADDLYAALRTPIGGPALSDINWDSFAPKKVQVFFWILRHGRTKTRGSLHRHGSIDSPDCPFCPGIPEEADHLFVMCPRLQQLWARVMPGGPLLPTTTSAAEALRVWLHDLPPQAANAAVVAVFWVIWKARNAMIFHDELQSAETIARHLQAHLKLWVCRAPTKLDVEPLKLWCQTVVDVN